MKKFAVFVLLVVGFLAVAAATPNMSLSLPTVGSTVGPTWASMLNTAITAIDSHDHSPGKGVQIGVDGLDIDGDFEINSHNVTEVNSLRLDSQISELVGGADIRALYSVGGELYYNDSSGTAVQITDGGSLNSSLVGGFGSEYTSAGASAIYTDTTKLFTFRRPDLTTANMLQADTTLQDGTPVLIFSDDTTNADDYQIAVDGNLLYYQYDSDDDGAVEKTNLLVVDGVNSRVGINNSSPSNALDVSGIVDSRGTSATVAFYDSTSSADDFAWFVDGDSIALNVDTDDNGSFNDATNVISATATSVSVGKNLGVTGSITASSSGTFGGSISVTSNAVIGGTLGVTGATSSQGNISVNNAAPAVIYTDSTAGADDYKIEADGDLLTFSADTDDNGTYDVSNQLTLNAATATIAAKSHITGSTNNTYDLGTSSVGWRAIYGAAETSYKIPSATRTYQAVPARGMPEANVSNVVANSANATISAASTVLVIPITLPSSGTITAWRCVVRPDVGSSPRMFAGLYKTVYDGTITGTTTTIDSATTSAANGTTVPLSGTVSESIAGASYYFRVGTLAGETAGTVGICQVDVTTSNLTPYWR